MLTEFSDDVVPLLVASKSRGTQAVRTVFMSSKEDKDLFKVWEIRIYSVTHNNDSEGLFNRASLDSCF